MNGIPAWRNQLASVAKYRRTHCQSESRWIPKKINKTATPCRLVVRPRSTTFLVERIGADILLVGPHHGSAFYPRLLEVGLVLEFPEHSELQQRPTIIDAGLAVCEREFEPVTGGRTHGYNSRIHRYLKGSILYGCCPLTASSQSACNSSP